MNTFLVIYFASKIFILSGPYRDATAANPYTACEMNGQALVEQYSTTPDLVGKYTYSCDVLYGAGAKQLIELTATKHMKG